MLIRFLAAFAIMFGIFPFLTAYSFIAASPDATFNLDLQTWTLGLVPIVGGWLLFLAPGLLPFMGPRYFAWVGRVTGTNAVGEHLRRGYHISRATLTSLPETFRRLTTRTPLKTIDTPSSPETPAPSSGLPTDAAAVTPQLLGFPGSNPPSHPQSGTTDQPAQTATLAPSTSLGGLKARLAQFRERVAAAAANPETHVDTAKTKLRSLRDRVSTLRADGAFSPASLNEYTLEAVGHLKAIAKLSADSLNLDPADQAFVELVLHSIPEPAMPGEEEPTPPGPLDYPDERRPDLIAAAGRLRISLTEEDFENASTGDLERGLKVMLAVISVAEHLRRRSQYDDPMLVLPLQQTA